ncbi:helix-turn-helix transcriptional regulator [Photobacterium leiognathi]|uniref:helix-turn-helix transcriptional regulator n=1 Tax=Photobacterium leiognathi TaxID=553611 RepID=UPI000769C1D9|nr:AraC family transcriptional regulator [Photobacterium leiognathi]
MIFKQGLINNKVILERFHLQKHCILIFDNAWGKLEINGYSIPCHNQVIAVIPKYSHISCNISQYTLEGIKFNEIEIDDNHLSTSIEHAISLCKTTSTQHQDSTQFHLDKIPSSIDDNIALLNQAYPHLNHESKVLLVKQCLPYILHTLICNGINIANIFNIRRKNDIRTIITDLVLQAPDQSWNIEDVANALNITISTLRRQLEKEGYKFSQLIIDIRMGIVLNYLTFTDYSINEISVRVGFCSISYFSNAFKKKYGITPSQFRRQSKTKNDMTTLKEII